MPIVQGIDDFAHANFAVPGGASYSAVDGSPARDTSFVRGLDPASLLISTTAANESVRHTISGTPSLGWHAFAFRMNTGEEPAGDVDVCYLATVAGSSGRLSYAPSVNQLYHYVGGGAPVYRSISLDAWHWVEQILDAASNPRVIYTRVDGVDLTSVSAAETGSTANGSYLGTVVGDTIPASRYSCHLWGSASSTSDWLGEVYTSYLGDAPAVWASFASSGVTQTFTMPWEALGSPTVSSLGQIPSTASVVRVYQETRNPAVTDDSTQGYAVGDVWIYNVTAWWCVSSAASAAVWKKVTA